MQNEPIEVTIRVTQIFEKLNIPYLIGGSLASTLYGMIRTTQDSDIVAEMQLEHLQPFVSALQDEFYLDDEMISESIQRHSSFNIIHRESMFKGMSLSLIRDLFYNLNLPAFKSKPFYLKMKSARTFAVPKIRSCPNSNGIVWAVRFRSGNGVTFLAC